MLCMYVNWEKGGEITVEDRDDNDRSVSGHAYRGLGEYYRLAAGNVVEDESELIDHLVTRYGETIKELVKDFRVEWSDRDCADHGVWGPEQPSEGDYMRGQPGAYYQALAVWERAIDQIQFAREEFQREIEDDCYRQGSDPLPGCLVEYEAAAYFQEAPPDVTKDTTDREIADLATELADEARAEGCAVDGIEDYLVKLRDEAREAWTEAHTCPCCGEPCPESMLNEDEPSWECATCHEGNDDEYGPPLGVVVDPCNGRDCADCEISDKASCQAREVK